MMPEDRIQPIYDLINIAMLDRGIMKIIQYGL